MNWKECGSEVPNKTEWVKIPELGIEVETELHTDMDKISKIVIPKGLRLLTFSEWMVCYNKYKNKFNWGGLPDEIVSQPIDENNDKYPYWNVWFRSLGGRSVLYGYDRDLISDSRVRGVRFCRELKKGRK